MISWNVRVLVRLSQLVKNRHRVLPPLLPLARSVAPLPLVARSVGATFQLFPLSRVPVATTTLHTSDLLEACISKLQNELLALAKQVDYIDCLILSM